jgi:hypothetical protein
MTAAETRLIVPPGTPLSPGKLYLRLYHGRTDPDQTMDGWGFDGPTFGPLSAVVETYVSHLRLYGEWPTDELWLDRHDDMIRFENAYDGDLEILVAVAGETARRP